MQPKLKMRLGDLLVHENVITEAQLQDALNRQKTNGRKLGQSLVEMGIVSEQKLLTFLAQQLNVPLIDLTQIRLDPDVVKKIPEVQARRFRALAIREEEKHILVGMSDPADLVAFDALSNVLPKPIKLAVVREAQLLQAFDNQYRRTDEIESFAQELASEYQDSQNFDFMQAATGEEDTAVARLLQSIFEDAVQMKASDIHIEPEKDVLRIRQRVDGVLQENVIRQANIASALVLRLKLMSGLDISEKRLPQDGRTQVTVKGHTVDVRLSTMPIQGGESVVMRLLDQSAGLLTLEQTGMPQHMVDRYRILLQRPHGMILVTGPTGSGKSTTLYASLAEMNKANVKIITVEDPVEYRLPRINQVQINDKIGLRFSNVLRTALRQDPDVIMVGEMRDTETVEIGMRGALTGHLVLSTLHTNDAISSAVRLLDMGAPGYLVASSLRAIIAQRLIRRNCEQCATDYQPLPEERFWLSNIDPMAAQMQFKQGQGCDACNLTGYRGRVGVFELLEMTESMMEALKNSDNNRFTNEAEKAPNYRPLAHMALEYAAQGITSVGEVLRLVETVADVQSVKSAPAIQAPAEAALHAPAPETSSNPEGQASQSGPNWGLE
ncbi:GspE/PulE family protein [Bowmanella sp. JS7-9]|uniref:GspE/PulE family protein n=1 Tax=Pseudobowmanella zhangzhouensis TaxID=1537679 RepID=A0ABW1XNB5_9ALTE|nr:GspE/PulE family protein [Bowmanella sp. JS7-9]